MNNDILSEFVELYLRLSPESLHEDGEISVAEARRKEKRIMKEWKALEIKLGRRVTEEEIYSNLNVTRNTYFVVMKMKRWEDTEFEVITGPPSSFEIKMKPDPGQVGYMPIFDNYKAALEVAGSKARVLAIRAINEKGNGITYDQ